MAKEELAEFTDDGLAVGMMGVNNNRIVAWKTRRYWICLSKLWEGVSVLDRWSGERANQDFNFGHVKFGKPITYPDGEMSIKQLVMWDLTWAEAPEKWVHLESREG